MQIVEVGPFLEHSDLLLLPLKALEPSRELYHAILLQPEGYLEANSQRVGHADQASASQMCTRFLELARERHADLVVAPEYCVPWTVVESMIAGGLAPAEGAIWALGCESITPQALRELRSRVDASGGSVRLLFEPLMPREEARKAYIDPLVYVFWTQDRAGARVLCLLVQFKTAACRDERQVELTSLYLGEQVYRFDGGVNGISLMGIICSDAFEFTEALVDENHRNTLILHIQLNPKPGHDDYSTYRRRLFSVATNSNTEVLCLNWARDVVDVDGDGTVHRWRNNAGSAWYLPVPKCHVSDHEFDALHERGLYHCLVNDHWHAFYLNHAPHVLSVRMQKPLVGGPQALVPRIAPIVLDRWRWHSSTGELTADDADDGFATIASEYEALQPHVSKLRQGSKIAVERALELLEGPPGSPHTWYSVTELAGLRVDAGESIRRSTVHQEKDDQQPGVAYRRRRLRRAHTALRLATEPVVWPPPLRDLHDGFVLSWCESEPHCNVRPTSEAGAPATLIYLDEDPETARVEALYGKLKSALWSHRIQQLSTAGAPANEIADAIARATDRLCLVFRRDHVLTVHQPAPQFTRPGDVSAFSITGEST